MGRSYDHARRKIVNPPRLPEWALPAGERLEKARQAAIQRAAQEIGTPSGEGHDAGYPNGARRFCRLTPLREHKPSLPSPACGFSFIATAKKFKKKKLDTQITQLGILIHE